MSLFSLIAVLLLEQVRPLSYRQAVLEPLVRLADSVERRFNAGESPNGMLAWLLLAGIPSLSVLLVFLLLLAINPLLAWAWNVAVLYLTMGFRQFSHYYTDIQLALRMEDLPRARELLAEWRGRPAGGLSASEVARLAIEEALVASHRHVFAVLVGFVLLPGPAGAVLYRIAAVLDERWGARRDAEFGDFGAFARRAFAFIDWLPQRVTAFGFAVVGNFEDAVYCWRTQAARWAAEAPGIVLASGAGALGVRLGMPLAEEGELAERGELGVGHEADVDFMQSAVGLVWRALVLWLLLLLLLGLASLVGR